MTGPRFGDGSAGDANYQVIGTSYSKYRQPEPRIAEQILWSLGSAKSVLNVGAGAGSYEPLDRDVTAVEPSASMRKQRPSHLPKAIDAYAEDLPFHDNHFDAAMATFSIHQWRDYEAGLRELRRVAKGPVVILTCDPTLVQRFWLNDYAPLVLSTEARRYQPFEAIAAALGKHLEVIPVSIPLDCKDGFNEAYYGRPEMLLDDYARLSCSAWSFVDEATSKASIAHLAESLSDGGWDTKYGHLRTQSEYGGSLRILVATP